MDEQRVIRLQNLAVAGQRPADTAWLLVLDSLIFQAEAEVRWLDLCEARMVQAQGRNHSN